MNRRRFLELIGLAGGMTSAATLLPGFDLDCLLWIPGEKKIFVPPAFREIRLSVAWEPSEISPNFVQDAIQHLLAEAKLRGITKFKELPHVKDCWPSELFKIGGVPIRHIKAFDLFSGSYIERVDLVGS